MDNVRYVCYCRSVFYTLIEFESHFPCCESIKDNSVFGKGKRNPLQMNDDKVEKSKIKKPRQEFNIKLIKSWGVVVDEGQRCKQPMKFATNIWGRRLPRRTKVPFMTRAIPLSTDHSFERCQCGAVFVTRMGKRQHQARFCKYVKSKTKNMYGDGSCEGTTAQNFLPESLPNYTLFTSKTYVTSPETYELPDVVNNKQLILLQF